jgi:maltodextrin utilization protein YvdJ
LLWLSLLSLLWCLWLLLVMCLILSIIITSLSFVCVNLTFFLYIFKNSFSFRIARFVIATESSRYANQKSSIRSL